MRCLADTGRFYTDDNGIILLVRKLASPTPVRSDKSGGCAARPLDDEPTRKYVPLLTRPWNMPAWNADASYNRGVVRTPSMVERFYWWMGINTCTR